MKTRSYRPSRRGFALVVTLSMMILLTVVAIGLLSLSSITLRATDANSAQAVAQANARLAMILAIGQLQQAAGPDRRISGTALVGKETSTDLANPQWTGVWRSDSTTAGPTWLVSGDAPDPARALNENNSALLASTPATDTTRKELRAEYVPVPGERFEGRYAYWVGDEGTKARVDVAPPDTQPQSLAVRERTLRSQSPLEPGLTAIDEVAFASFQSGSDTALGPKKRSIASLKTVSLAAEKGEVSTDELPQHYFNDLTIGGFGLPVNVKDGGMKMDLSLLFDRSQSNKAPMLTRYLGARPVKNQQLQTYDSIPSVTDPSKFFLSKQITRNGALRVGPNWGNLFSYGRLWENLNNGNSAAMVHASPRPSSDLRHENWRPYENSKVGSGNEWQQDPQHGNSPITPVLSMIQLTFRVKVVSEGTGTADDPPVGKYYVPGIEVKPVIGLWNPYNVAIRNAGYTINWAVAPYFRLAHAPSGGQDITEVWLRDYWKQDPGTLPSENTQGGGYFNLTIPSVNMQPGEFRMFSVNTPQDLAGGGGSNTMVGSWGEAGGFHMPIKRSKNHADGKQQAGAELRVPAGNDIWFGACMLQDTHLEKWEWNGTVGTKARFPTIANTAASTWIAIKSGDGGQILGRYTNFWNGGVPWDSKSMGVPSSNSYFMPEPVRHSSESSPQTQRKFRIDNLAAGDVGHLASWRFHLRTSATELKTLQNAPQNQGLRSWIDANPRPLASSVRFDGSSVKPGGVQGWNMVSSFVGDSNDYPTIMGDKKGGNRGLVAEGQLGMMEPPGVENNGRYQGLGGPSAYEEEGGVPNVMIFDVPRSPLVSIGQFQHAQLSRYNHEPGFVVGNSYANPRIPLGETVVQDFAGIQGMQVVDISHEVNDRLWDSAFFSTLGLDYLGASGSFDSAFGYDELVSGARTLPNPRMVFTPLPGDSSINAIINGAGIRAPEAIGTRIRIEGAFNVNSTSKNAWKAVLSTLGSSELPVISLSATNPLTSWTQPEGVRFNRFGHVATEEPYVLDGGNTDAFWRGWRKLSAKELDDLATEIVKEVRERGPFRTMGEFVNRDPKGKTEHQLKGALQAALDRAVNAKLPKTISLPASKPPGNHFSAAITNEKQAAGHSSYILQGDILQALGPILQVRSDYYRIRTCGEALDKSGKVVAKAWCEAFVQRVPEYVDAADNPEIPEAELNSSTNQEFGRRFKVTSFRWLSPSEI